MRLRPDASSPAEWIGRGCETSRRGWEDCWKGIIEWRAWNDGCGRRVAAAEVVLEGRRRGGRQSGSARRAKATNAKPARGKAGESGARRAGL
jgi:hypothetical protein